MRLSEENTGANPLELNEIDKPELEARKLRFGVISDTHGAAIPERVTELFKDCDLIIHAGDIGQQTTLDELELIAPVRAVLGNNDRYKKLLDSFGRVEDYISFKLGEVSVHLTHQPEHLPSIFKTGNSPKKEKALLIHGHTHIPKIEKHSSFIVLNPGAISRPRGGSLPSVALITVEGDQIQTTIHQL